jgi:DNA-directed RNA polymerase specialized sigma24 family protein
LAEYVKTNITQLPTKQRQAVELVYVVDLTISEAAAVMNCSEKTLYKNLQRAIHRLENICGFIHSYSDKKIE